MPMGPHNAQSSMMSVIKQAMIIR